MRLLPAGAGSLLRAYTLVDLFSMYRHGRRRADTDTNLRTLYTQHRHGDIITDH